jgi:hypothetical protein
MRKKTLGILKHFAQHPEKTVPQVAKDLGYPYQTVYMAKRNHMDKAESKKSEPKLIMEYVAPEKTDPVNSPAHYLVGGIETIDFIEAKQLNYNLGNAVKYIARSGHKDDRKQDIEKAVWYLNREISRML